VLTFLIAWSIWLPLGIFAPHKVLLTLPGAWAPTLSALILNGLSDGKAGVRQFLRRVIYWRVDLRWYVVVLFSIAIIAYLSIGVGLMLGVPAPEISLPNGLPRNGLLIALPILFLINSFVGGPLAEDIGWRGYILPTLRERMSAFTASLIIGVIWSIWHLPYFIFPEWNAVVGSIPFLWFMLLTTSWSVLLAWVYVHTESILMPVLYHAAINTTLGTLGVLGQDDKALRLIIINTAITWVMAGIVVAMYGFDLKRSRMNV
jgi:membrane protease YdiL (CAAX protease family)